MGRSSHSHSSPHTPPLTAYQHHHHQRRGGYLVGEWVRPLKVLAANISRYNLTLTIIFCQNFRWFLLIRSGQNSPFSPDMGPLQALNCYFLNIVFLYHVIKNQLMRARKIPTPALMIIWATSATSISDKREIFKKRDF